MSSETAMGLRRVDHNDGQSVPMLLVTANVGSLFEDPSRLLQPWIKEFLTKVSASRPQFLALHLQEVGGKTYEKSMECVQKFIQYLCEASEMEDFIYIRVYMDEDFNSAEHFTALGNLYFVHKDIQSVRMWNFLTHDWENVDNKSIYSGNIETVPSKEKSKFPQHFFPECKWSRKGFMRTRWEINFTVFDLVNIHLFHDASNLAACEEFPSVYCKTRRRALVYTLERFHLDDKNGCAPYFLFGDFNFRCDTGGVIKELTENLTAHRVQSIKSDSTKVHYRNSVGNNVLTIGKKEFNYADHQLKFKEAWLKKFDRELEALNEILVEYSIEFPPSYPYEEDPEMPTDYMSTRCPSWCDRILMSPLARDLIVDQPSKSSYHMIGGNVCMGDHKPIYLNIRLKQNQGTYRCCKCYLSYSDNMRPSSIHRNHEETPVTVEANDSPKCPYRSSAYREMVSDCNKEIKQSISIKDHKRTNEMASLPMAPISKEPTASIPNGMNSNINNNNNKCPPVTINIFDTDNIYVCRCAQIAKETDDQIDGAICPECRNIIKKQPLEHRYRIVSKRLMLPNNIIVNRIDTQYLNTFSDSGRRDRPDPYTPESAESHSPCPEFNNNNSSTSTSSSGHSPFGSTVTTSQHEAIVSREKTKSRHSVETAPTNRAEDSSTAVGDFYEKQKLLKQERQRQQHENKGVVSPGQLKSRLEDLQKSCSHKDMDIDGNTVAAATGDDIADDDDVDDDANYVDDLRTATISVPDNLRKIVQETLSEDAVWKEQAHVVDVPEPNAGAPLNTHSNIVSVKSQYVQISSLKPIYTSDSAGATEVQSAEEDSDVENTALTPNCTAAPPILKETTV